MTFLEEIDLSELQLGGEQCVLDAIYWNTHPVTVVLGFLEWSTRMVCETKPRPCARAIVGIFVTAAFYVRGSHLAWR